MNEKLKELMENEATIKSVSCDVSFFEAMSMLAEEWANDLLEVSEEYWEKSLEEKEKDEV